MIKRLLILIWAFWTVAADSARAQDAKFEAVILKNGNRFEGLIVSEAKEAVRFKQILRTPGSRMRVFETTFEREEIDRLQRLPESERERLRQVVDQLSRRSAEEQARMQALRLEPATWPGHEPARQYAGKHFIMLSNAREDIVRRVIVSLEDMFAAYARHLGTRRQPSRPLRILFYKSMAEYRETLQKGGLNILNPAFYDPQKNQIVAASDLESQAADLEKLRQKHDAMLQELEQYEKKLRKHFHGRPPAAMLGPLRSSRRQLHVVNNENESTFDRLHRPLFATLYHEAFHAYLENFVYAGGDAAVPRWLNEGLAQIFETALVDIGELRVGHIDDGRLRSIKESARRRQLPTLTELLQSSLKHFQVAHVGQAAASDKYFLASWGLAYYLTFERKLLEGETLDRYMQSLQRGTNPLDAFRDIVQQPLDAFEEQFRQYLLDLRPDGSVKR